jgi:HEPN domain-containing protein
MKKTSRAADWLAQAENDQQWAVASFEAGFYAQTCFICQQTAEKALKALGYHRGADLVKGHSVRMIARDLGIDEEIEHAAKVLDQYYITGRYPDALPAGAPFEFITRKQAEEAIALAALVIKRVRDELHR